MSLHCRSIERKTTFLAVSLLFAVLSFVELFSFPLLPPPTRLVSYFCQFHCLFTLMRRVFSSVRSLLLFFIRLIDIAPSHWVLPSFSLNSIVGAYTSGSQWPLPSVGTLFTAHRQLAAFSIFTLFSIETDNSRSCFYVFHLHFQMPNHLANVPSIASGQGQFRLFCFGELKKNTCKWPITALPIVCCL